MAVSLTTLGAWISWSAGLSETGSLILFGNVTIDFVIGSAVVIGANAALTNAMTPAANRGDNQPVFPL